MGKDFNKQEEDFESLREYNDYLEMVEDIIFNLTNNLDILETNKKIQQYKEENKDNIVKNRSRLSKDALELLDILSMEEKYDVGLHHAYDGVPVIRYYIIMM